MYDLTLGPWDGLKVSLDMLTADAIAGGSDDDGFNGTEQLPTYSSNHKLTTYTINWIKSSLDKLKFWHQIVNKKFNP